MGQVAGCVRRTLALPARAGESYADVILRLVERDTGP
jgi:hypothetical protein